MTLSNDQWSRGMRTYAAECLAATLENLLDRRYCLRRAALRPETNSSIVKAQLWIVDQQIAKRKEETMSGEARETCRVPDCGLTVQRRGLCYKHIADHAAVEQYALPSRQGSHGPRTGSRPAKAVPKAASPQARGQAETPRRPAAGEDLVVAIPRAEVTDDLAALLFRRGARVLQ